MINIEVLIDQETKETWSFHMFDLNAVFVYWKREVKPKGKRKWIIEKSWDKYKERDRNATPRPELPEIIRSQALSEVMKMIRVYTLDEWKSCNCRYGGYMKSSPTTNFEQRTKL